MMNINYKNFSEMTIIEYCRRLKELKGDLAARSQFIFNWKQHKHKLKNKLC